MITTICNLRHEGHIDSFYKIVVLRSQYLRSFTPFMDSLELQEVFSNLLEAVDGFDMELLPDNVNVTHAAINGPNGSRYNTSASFFVSPQEEETKALMEQFLNNEVVVLIHKNTKVHIYGTKEQPLLFSYSEVNGNSPGTLKGYTVSVSGSTTAGALYMPSTDFNIINKGLAFTLARQL